MTQPTTIFLTLTQSMSRTRRRFEELQPDPFVSPHTFYLRNEVWLQLGKPRAITLAVTPHSEGGDSP